MKLGVHLVNFTLAGGPEAIGPTLAATGRAAEEAGLGDTLRGLRVLVQGLGAVGNRVAELAEAETAWLELELLRDEIAQHRAPPKR